MLLTMVFTFFHCGNESMVSLLLRWDGGYGLAWFTVLTVGGTRAAVLVFTGSYS